MNKKEFLQLAKNNGASNVSGFGAQENIDANDIVFISSWVSGGVTGKSCWGTESKDVVGESPVDDINGLDKFLEIVNSDISFLQYKGLLSRCIISGEYSSGSDYYGNCTDYAYKAVSVNKLFVEMNEIFPEIFTVEDRIKKIKP